MIRNAQEYGSLNVHMRAKRSELFTAGTYNLLVSATDFYNLTQMLANTKYKEIIGPEMSKDYPNLIVIDRYLTQFFLNEYNHYRRYIPKQAKGFIDVIIKRYYFNNIKILLTALHSANLSEANEMLLTLNDEEEAEIKELFKTKTIEEFIQTLSNKDLKEALNNVLGEYNYLKLVYPLLTTVDQYYYKMLCKEISKLTSDDKYNTISLLGTQMGLQNVEIILRSKTIKISPTIVKNWIVTTKYCPLKEALVHKLIDAQDLKSTIDILKNESPYRELALRIEENLEKERDPLSNLDRFNEQIIIHKANSIFRGASFHVAIFPAYFLLMELEIKNIRTIILGKIHKKSVNDILERIVLV